MYTSKRPLDTATETADNISESASCDMEPSQLGIGVHKRRIDGADPLSLFMELLQELRIPHSHRA